MPTFRRRVGSGRGGEQADLVIEAIAHHDHEVRRDAVRLIPRLEPAYRMKAMRRAIDSHDSVVRRHAAGMLSEVDGRDTLPVKQMALYHFDPQVRLAATRSLGQIILEAPVTETHSHASYASLDRFQGWEHKWSAEGPDFWGLEEQGFLARYNRVEGLFLGWRQAREYQSPWGVANYGEIGRGMTSDTWRWQAGGELFTYYGPPTFSSHLAAVDVELHDLTDTQDGWLISEEENSVDAALLCRDYRDHYRRTGGSLYTSHNVGGVLQVGGRWSRDRYESIDNVTDWALFGESWSDPTFRNNPEVDEGDVTSERAYVQLDTRNSVGDPDRGWFINAYAERAGGVLGGDFRFKRYLLDLRRYQPMGPGTRLDLRLLGDGEG
ncbi:MAG: HEAT repeat domain-containing protein [Candidatus Latescibacterota bacterium]